MDIFGIGITEILFIVILILVFFGPKDLVTHSRNLAKWWRGILTSEGWRSFQRTNRELRNLPNQMIREAGIEDIEKELKAGMEQANPTKISDYLVSSTKNEIMPPSLAKAKPDSVEPSPSESANLNTNKNA